MVNYVGIVIQARMGSSRLPGKVLADLAGAPLLTRLIEKLRRAKGVDKIIVATSNLVADDAIAAHLDSLPDIKLWRGPENDVLTRYAEAARHFELNTIVRITADNPFMEPQDIEIVLAAFFAQPCCDYADNLDPRSVPYGCGLQVVSRRALDRLDREAYSPHEREHVLVRIVERPHDYNVIHTRNAFCAAPQLRLTVDHPEDLALARAIYERLYSANPNFTLKDVLMLRQREPKLFQINSMLKTY